MTTDASALLDELMGRTRNLLPSEKHLANERRWSDSDVCKYFLCGFCPHELFTNTKADLGSCSKVHDEELKRNYEESDSKWKRGYEEDFLRYLESIVGDMDKKIDRGRGRLKQNEEYVKEETKRMPPEKTERVKKLSEAISQQVQKMEDLGNDGLVEEAQEVMQKVEQLKRERDTILMANKSALAIMLDDNVEKRMEVCDVCGSFLVVNDLQVRVDAHVSGKQHRGFAMLRDKIREVKAEKEKIRDERRRDWQQQRNTRESDYNGRQHGDRHRDRRDERRDERRHRHRSRSRSGERRRKRHSRSRSRSREGDRRRHSNSRSDKKRHSQDERH